MYADWQREGQTAYAYMCSPIDRPHASLHLSPTDRQTYHTHLSLTAPSINLSLPLSTSIFQ
jgi:hypothetical protein